MQISLLASPRLTLTGFAALGAAVVGGYVLERLPAWTISAALLMLAINLAANLCQVAPLRRRGLGVFHFALLGCLLLVAFGRLTHFNGRVSIADGQEFEPQMVESLSRGAWHSDGYRDLRFTQGPFTVSYAPGVRREETRSQVALAGAVDGPWQTVGDDHPLELDGYRFYTTHNKGFAPILTWLGSGRPPVSGAVMLPSYPLNDWQQEQRWVAPDGVEWRFWLRQARPIDESNAWLLDPRRTDAILVAERAGRRFELRPGDEARDDFGALRYEWLTGWMGYKISYDPTLIPLLLLSVLGVLGLAWHLWSAPSPLRRQGGAAQPAAGGFKPTMNESLGSEAPSK